MHGLVVFGNSGRLLSMSFYIIIINVRMCNPYNLNHTRHIENYKQHIADLQMVALSLSYLILIQFSQLTSTGWMVVCILGSDP